jgi:hypothetical protein
MQSGQLEPCQRSLASQKVVVDLESGHGLPLVAHLGHGQNLIVVDPSSQREAGPLAL